MSIISATVSTHLSECLVVSSERGDRKILKFPIKTLIDVALFQIVKATSGRRIVLKVSGTNIGRIITFYLKTFINFLASSCCNYLFPVPKKILEIYDLIRQQKFQILSHTSFLDIMSLRLVDVLILIFVFPFLQGVSSYFVWINNVRR